MDEQAIYQVGNLYFPSVGKIIFDDQNYETIIIDTNIEDNECSAESS